MFGFRPHPYGVRPEAEGLSHGRAVIVAPVTVGEDSFYMGVMLKVDTNSNRLYIHDVSIKKEASSKLEASLVSTGAQQDEDGFFFTSILKK